MLNLNKIFSQIKECAGLKLDTVLVEEEQPILFTCTDNKHNVYLTVCPFANAEYVMWHMTKTNYNVLIELLKNEETIYDAFKDVSDQKYVIIYNKNGVCYDCVPFESLDENFLPVKGEFMDAEEDEYSEEIKLFEERMFTKYINCLVKKTKIYSVKVPIRSSIYRKYTNSTKYGMDVKVFDYKEKILCSI